MNSGSTELEQSNLQRMAGTEGVGYGASASRVHTSPIVEAGAKLDSRLKF